MKRATTTELVLNYIRKNPAATQKQVQKAIGKRKLSSSTYSGCRRKLGIPKGNGKPCTAKAIQIGTPVPRAGSPPKKVLAAYAKRMNTRDRLLRVCKLVDEIGIDELKRMVDVLDSLDR